LSGWQLHLWASRINYNTLCRWNQNMTKSAWHFFNIVIKLPPHRFLVDCSNWVHIFVIKLEA
jgi:hypothetical protein